MARTRMLPSAWIEVNGLRPDWAKPDASFDAWWSASHGDTDKREELLQLGCRWFESGTSPGLESLTRSSVDWRQEIAAVVLRDIVGEDPGLGRWRGDDGYTYRWDGVRWHKEGIASVELRGMDTLPHATAACASRGCSISRCRDALQRLRKIARIPGRPVNRVYT